MQDAFIGASDVDIGVGNVVACVCRLSFFCTRCVSMRGLDVSMCCTVQLMQVPAVTWAGTLQDIIMSMNLAKGGARCVTFLHIFGGRE